MSNQNEKYVTSGYFKKRRKLSGFFYEIALPNEYLVQMGQKKIKPILGGKKLRLFKKFLRIPASVQTLYFKTDNANMDYQGIGIEGYASWRIDPERPEVAITTLDFFDDNDPMARTNSELQTICVEAVRHVIANMSIDDALKKKDEIGDDLKQQLKSFEEKWGIIFDQVGIESVRIMSKTLFENLQSSYRDNIRLDVEKKKISTDKQIAAEQNLMKEKTELERLETEKKIELANVDNNTRVKELELKEQEIISAKERDIREKEYRNEIAFKTEQSEKDHEYEILEKELDLKVMEKDKSILLSRNELEAIEQQISRSQLELDRLRREVSQIYSSGALTQNFVEKLPELFESLSIDNYTVIDSGKDGGISPVTRLVQELITLARNNGVDSLFKKAGEAE